MQDYPWIVVGGTGRVIASFITQPEAIYYAKLHPAYRAIRKDTGETGAEEYARLCKESDDSARADFYRDFPS